MVVLVNGELTESAINMIPGANIRGYGSVTANGLDNQGTISADGGTLILDSSGNNMDLDGATDDGVLNAVDGDLEIREGDDVVFEGSLNVGVGRSFTVDGGLRVPNNGPEMIHLSGGTIASDSLVVNGI